MSAIKTVVRAVACVVVAALCLSGCASPGPAIGPLSYWHSQHYKAQPRAAANNPAWFDYLLRGAAVSADAALYGYIANELLDNSSGGNGDTINYNGDYSRQDYTASGDNNTITVHQGPHDQSVHGE